jgi:hypothetical protein
MFKQLPEDAINLVLTSPCFPERWKMAVVVMLPKSSQQGKVSQLKTHRPFVAIGETAEAVILVSRRL